MLDSLASLSEAELIQLQRQSSAVQAPTERRHNLTDELFRYDLYDWTRFANPGYVPLQLSKGYFTYVSSDRIDELRATFSFFYANVQRCPQTNAILKIYARAGGNGQKEVYLHRHLTRTRRSAVLVDHSNALTLDNRDDVLVPKKIAQNSINYDSSVRRARHKGLPRGVYPVSSGGYKAQIKHNDVTYRSPDEYETPELAHEWYRRMHKKIFRFDFIDHTQRPNFPIFPPRKGEPTDVPY